MLSEQLLEKIAELRKKIDEKKDTEKATSEFISKARQFKEKHGLEALVKVLREELKDETAGHSKYVVIIERAKEIVAVVRREDGSVVEEFAYYPGDFWSATQDMENDLINYDFTIVTSSAHYAGAPAVVRARTLTDNQKSNIWQLGCWPGELSVTAEDGVMILPPNLARKFAKEATAARKNNKFLIFPKEMYDKYRETSTTDVSRSLEQDLPFWVPRKDVRAKQPVNKLNESPLTLYLTGGKKQAETYGYCLQNRGIDSVLQRVVRADFVKALGNPVVSGVWLGSFNGVPCFYTNAILEDDGDSRVCGVHKVPAGRIQEAKTTGLEKSVNGGAEKALEEEKNKIRSKWRRLSYAFGVAAISATALGFGSFKESIRLEKENKEFVKLESLTKRAETFKILSSVLIGAAGAAAYLALSSYEHSINSSYYAYISRLERERTATDKKVLDNA